MSRLGPDGTGGRYFGLYPAIVTDLVDPEELGRVQLRFPFLGEDGAGVRAWATLLSVYAEDDQGFQAVPSVDTQVVVGFEAGDLRRPYVVGAAWNGQEAMPHTPTASNDLRTIRTRSGCELVFDDTDGQVKITLSTPGGHSLVLDDGALEVEVSHSAGPRVTLTAAGAVEIDANSKVEVTAPMVKVNAPMSDFSGIVKCSVLQANTVIGSTYTPGAGNIW